MLPPTPGGWETQQNLTPRGSGLGLAGRLEAPGCSKGCPHIQTVLASRRRRRPGRVVRKPLCKPRGDQHPLPSYPQPAFPITLFPDQTAPGRLVKTPRREPPALPRPNPPQTSSLHSEVRGPRVKSSRFRSGFHPGGAGWNTNRRGPFPARHDLASRDRRGPWASGALGTWPRAKAHYRQGFASSFV